MTRLSIRLLEDERKALVELARREYREPRDQAALLIRRALESAGLLAAEVAAEVPALQGAAPSAESGHANA